jgi:hypothetical protein
MKRASYSASLISGASFGSNRYYDVPVQIEVAPILFLHLKLNGSTRSDAASTTSRLIDIGRVQYYARKINFDG